MTDPIRLLLADDHPIVREGLRAILSTQPDFEIVGEAADGRQLVAQAIALRPDVVLTDLEMPGLDGVEAIRQIRAALPDTQVIVLTAFNTDDRIVNSIQAGAQGYLLKGAPRSEIFNAIRVVHAGGSLLHPLVASRLIQSVRTPDSPPAETLTEREMDVMRLLAQGKANKEIAATLNITERTVKFHVAAILGKLDAGNRTEAVTLAVQRGLIAL
ncbi:MAG: response regulator [Aggregatilineales bacterium]